jgi:hypothetical protein
MVKRDASEAAISVDAINMKEDPIIGNIADMGVKVAKGVKANGAWRYPGGVIQRHADRWINGQEYYDPKDPGENRRKIESNFFITLNTNRSLKSRHASGASAANGKLQCKAVVDYLSKDAVICQYLKFGPKTAIYQSDRYDDIISKIEWQAAVETGENQERLHCHIWMTVHHYSQVQINMPVLQNIFKTEYNNRVKGDPALRITGRPYCNVKLLPTSDWAIVMRQYIHKGMVSSNP